MLCLHRPANLDIVSPNSTPIGVEQVPRSTSKRPKLEYDLIALGETAKILANPTRLKLLVILRDHADSELTTGEIMRLFGSGDQRIHRFLESMSKGHRIESRRQGLDRYYSLRTTASPEFDDLRRFMAHVGLTTSPDDGARNGPGDPA